MFRKPKALQDSWNHPALSNYSPETPGLSLSRKLVSPRFVSRALSLGLCGSQLPYEASWYKRVSTSSQDAQLQLDALVAAGVHKRDVFADVTSGTKAAIDRPGI